MRINGIRSRILNLGNRLGLFSSETMLKEEGADWYDDLYSNSDSYRVHYSQSFYYFLWAVIVDRLHRLGIHRVLEIGSGPGQLAAFLMDQGAEEYCGIDFSPKAVAMARRNAPRGRFLVADARSSEVHQQFEHEAVICTEVLEHIENDLLVVCNFLPGKRCFCSVPSFPYASHVRHFRSAQEVFDRYQDFFDDLDVATFLSPRSREDKFYLMDGVRNQFVLAR